MNARNTSRASAEACSRGLNLHGEESSDGPTGSSSSRDTDACAASQTSADCIKNARLLQWLQAVQDESEEIKRELLEALGTVPDLFWRESNPEKFLLSEKYDAKAAALRTCRYWKYRKQLFLDRAFLPMDLTGSGTMSPQDVKFYKQGTQMLLPGRVRLSPSSPENKTYHDANDDQEEAATVPVIFVDRNAVEELQIPDNIYMRICFYNAHLLAEDQTAVKHGFLILAHIPHLENVNQRGIFYKVMQEALVVQCHSFHVFLRERSADKPFSVSSALANFNMTLVKYTIGVAAVFGTSPLAKRSRFYTGSCRDYRGKILALGFNLQNVPHQLGGYLPENAFRDWMKVRVQLELERRLKQVDDQSRNGKTDAQCIHPEKHVREFDATVVPNAEADDDAQVYDKEDCEDAKPSARDVGQSVNMHMNPILRTLIGHDSNTPTTEFVPGYPHNPLMQDEMVVSSLDLLRRAFQQQQQSIHPMAGPATGPQQVGLQPLSLSSARVTTDMGQTQHGTGLVDPRLALAVAVGSCLHTTAEVPAMRSPANVSQSACVANNPIPIANPTVMSGNVCSKRPATSAGAPALTRNGYEERGLQPHVMIEETLPVLHNARVLFEAALKTIPFDEKVAYTEAMRKAPHVVEKETSVVSFLRLHNFDGCAAARRLVNYWQIRKALFGNRAFLPMTQNKAHGALSRDDVICLASGTIAILPKDESGRSVLISDRARSVSKGVNDNDIMSQLRCLFYVLNILAEEDAQRQRGVVVIACPVMPRLGELTAEQIKWKLSIVACAPLKLWALHGVVLPPKAGKKIMAERIAANAYAIASSFFADRVFLHSGTKPEDIIEKLKPFGINRENIPESIGGVWKYEEFIKFQRQRAEAENSEDCLGNWCDCGTVEDGSDEETPEERLARKRRLNAVHSRQKRERSKTKTENLQQQVDNLLLQNSNLKVEHRLLKALLDDAESKISQLECKKDHF